jgi:hypothetical protein
MATVIDSLSSDLAALAVDVRSRMRSLDAVLPDERDHRDATLLELATAYADRVARASFGAALLASVVATLAAKLVQAQLSYFSRTGSGRLPVHVTSPAVYDRADFVGRARWLTEWMEPLGTPWHAVMTIAFAMLVAAYARRRAMRRCFGVVDTADPCATARRMSARAQPWFVASWSAGLAAFAVFSCATIAFDVTSFGPWYSWILVHAPGALAWHAHQEVIELARGRELCAAVIATTIASVALARWQPRWLSARWIAYVAGIVAAVTLAVGFTYGHDCYNPRFPELSHETPLYLAVLAIGALAALVAASSFALRNRGER